MCRTCGYLRPHRRSGLLNLWPVSVVLHGGRVRIAVVEHPAGFVNESHPVLGIRQAREIAGAGKLYRAFDIIRFCPDFTFHPGFKIAVIHYRDEQGRRGGS